MVAFVLVYFATGQYSPLSAVGSQVFFTLLWLGILYSLLAGPFATVDCLARERREGTLGLLFLTDLRGYDVVIGKMAAASLCLAVGGAAALPLFAAPVLMGGVKLQQFGMVALSLLNTMLLSLAVGALASTIFESARAALAATALTLFTMTFGVPLVVEAFFHLNFRGRWAPYIYATCPLYGMIWCMDLRGGPRFPYWLNLAGTQAFAWVCLLWACNRVKGLWHSSPEQSASWRWWNTVWTRIRKGGPRWRRVWRKRMLDASPIAWLEGRDRLQSYVLWGLCLVLAGFCVHRHNRAPTLWPAGDDLFIWPLCAQYILCLWIAVQAPRRLADDKHSGALELLLCTSLPTEEIAGGAMTAMRRRFGRAFFGLLLFDLWLAYAYFDARGSRSSPGLDNMLKFGFWAAGIFTLQTYSFARVGLYQGLAQGSSVGATFILVLKLGLLPYVLFIVGIIVYENMRRNFPALGFLRENILIGLWVGAHLICFVAFLAHADYRLVHRFRVLGAAAKSRAFFARWRKSS